ncbi:hypothetical protein DRO31_01890 [Candidatus Bathyarchaeota archaeon]|nr:MAG: hypothetical protein DRO31_01890 [Candidatus Bathyarchaeota archaeon]
MRKTAAYIVSILFLFMTGLAILHPSYDAIASWLSPLTGGFIYTIFIVFTLLIADPFKYIAVGMVWILTGLLIGVISQKKLGSSIVAFLTWLSMIPTLGIAVFGVYMNLEARGVFTLESIDQILIIVPNVPAQLNLNSLFEIPIISELVFELIEIIPNMSETADPMQVMISLLMPYATAVALKPLLIIISSIIGAILGNLIFKKIDLKLLPTQKTVSIILIASIVAQAVYLPNSTAQIPEPSEELLAMLDALGIDPEELDPEALAEIGLTIEDLEAIAAIGVEEIDFETLTEMGIDPEIAIAIMMGISGSMNNTDMGGPILEIPINTDDGIYIELMGGFAENQGRAVTGEALIGSDIETVSSSAPYTQGLIASLILTQKINDPSFLYTLPIEDITNYVQFVGILPEIVAVNLYLGEDVDDISAKSDQIMEDYETLYGIEFSRIIAIQQSFVMEEEGNSELPLVVCLYRSSNTLDEITENMLSGFEDKGGIASSFQEVIDGEPRDIELYVFGQLTPSYLQELMPLPEDMAMFQELIDAVFSETFTFAVGAQTDNQAINPGSDIFDLTDSLDISAPRFSSSADIGAIAVARPNSTDPDPFVNLSINIDSSSQEFMFLYMYLNTIIPIYISGGMIPDAQDLRITLPDYSLPTIEVEKISQKSGDTETVSVTVTNDGSSVVTDLELDDVFPEKYGILSSGSNTATWTRLSPSESVSLSYEMQYERPGVYTNMPAVLKYEESGETRTSVSNIPPVSSKKPNGITLLTENYRATFEILDMLTGKGDLFALIPIAFIVLIAIVDVFKISRKRSKSDDQPLDEPVFPPPSPPEEPPDSSEDPL